ncbi:MAG: ATP-binding cassette domain-containing protein, partial [Chloroflexota bacterium]
MTTPDTAMTPLIQAQDLHLHFGGLAALSGVRFDIFPGEIVALIGPNGAGKTSALNCLNGFYRPQRGHIYFEGRDLTRVPTHRISQLGIART